MNKNKKIIQESIINKVQNYFQNDKKEKIVKKELDNPKDLEVFTLKHNINLDYTADNQEKIAERVIIAIEETTLY